MQAKPLPKFSVTHHLSLLRIRESCVWVNNLSVVEFCTALVRYWFRGRNNAYAPGLGCTRLLCTTKQSDAVDLLSHCISRVLSHQELRQVRRYLFGSQEPVYITLERSVNDPVFLPAPNSPTHPDQSWAFLLRETFSTGRMGTIVHPETFTCLSTAGPMSICFRTCFPILSRPALLPPCARTYAIRIASICYKVLLYSDMIPSFDYL